MRILFLSRWYPYPADNGSKIRVSNLLAGLCERHDVTLVSFVDPAETPAEPDPSTPAPVDIRVCPYREFAPRGKRAVLGLLSPTPRFLVDTRNATMERLIRAAFAERRYDLVVASQLPMAAYSDLFADVPAVFEEVELGIYRASARPTDVWARARGACTWVKHRRFLATLLDRFALCTVASEVERDLLATVVPGYRSVHVVPNSVRVDGPGAAGSPSRVDGSLIYTGSLRYGPNYDAMAWFVREILPGIRRSVPHVRLTITGDAGVRPLPDESNVRLTGRVADVRPLVARAAVSVAPIRVGGGTRLKILEAMAVRTPVVATAKAMEGLEAHHGEHLLIADTPQQFAQAVQRLLRDPAAAQAMAERAWLLLRHRYDARVVVPDFLTLVDRAAAA